MKRFLFLSLLALAVLMPTLANADTGYDQWGYNYQANMFVGFYENYSRPTVPVTESTDRLMMKWNDAWMDENKVRHAGYATYIDSGAWLTNHERWIDEDGTKHTYFVKIISACSNWTQSGGNWIDQNGDTVGPVIWGQFAVIQELLDGETLTKSEADSGLGHLENPITILSEEVILE